MRTTVRKWGNSLAIRIPSALADELDLRDGAEIQLDTRDGTLVASPVGRFTLDALVAGIVDEATHAEVEWGQPLGREIL